ncbi:MAG: SpoIIE family protein phosphatase [Planctomycetota bacterium]
MVSGSSEFEVFIKLEPLAGPPVDAFVIDPERSWTIGRSGQCEAQLPEKTVSRRHAVIAYRSDTWFMTDLESKHGTYVNGNRVEANTPHPINEGDLLRIGPWTFRVRTKETATSTLPTTNDYASSAHRVQKVPKQELQSLAQTRLDLIIECAAQINASSSENDLYSAMLDAVVSGTGFPRAAVIRMTGAEVEVLAYRGPSQRDMPSADLSFSRSLIQAAETSGGMVRMTSESQGAYGESIMSLGIHSALCGPIYLGEAIAGFLYLDARQSESMVQPDAAAFCQAVCRIGGLALSNFRRKQSQQQFDDLVRDVQAASAAQKMLMPHPHGQIGEIAYFMRMRPGRMVAGDLFNIIPLPDGKVAAYLGDVAGKGVGAAILMATTTTLLNMALKTHGEPAVALNEVNKQIATQVPGGKFISLWCGVFDTAAGTVTFVDAGHGHWLFRNADFRPQTVEASGGLPLGVEPDILYESETRPLMPGSRVILFSDGVIEQQSPEGEEYGLDQVIETLAAADSTDTEVNGLFQAVEDFAATKNLADDVTVASIECRHG